MAVTVYFPGGACAHIPGATRVEPRLMEVQARFTTTASQTVPVIACMHEDSVIAEFRIDHRAVIHHMNAFVRPPHSSYLAGFPESRIFTPSIA